MLNIVVVVASLLPGRANLLESGCEPRQRVPIALGLMDATVQVDYGGDSAEFGVGCLQGAVPW